MLSDVYIHTSLLLALHTIDNNHVRETTIPTLPCGVRWGWFSFIHSQYWRGRLSFCIELLIISWQSSFAPSYPIVVSLICSIWIVLLRVKILAIVWAPVNWRLLFVSSTLFKLFLVERAITTWWKSSMVLSLNFSSCSFVRCCSTCSSDVSSSPEKWQLNKCSTCKFCSLGIMTGV